MVSALRERVLEAKKILGIVMKRELSEKQAQTENSFGFKWEKVDTYSSHHVQNEWKRWLVEKYLDGKHENINSLLSHRNMKILDAGCGSGISAKLFFGEKLKEHQYYGVDISNAVELCEKEFLKQGISGKFSQCDLNDIDESFGNFDMIFSEGVLHHTDSVKNSLCNLSQRLKDGGKFLFYVYSKKAPIREFTDDLVRDSIKDLNNEEAWECLLALTELGKKLGELNVQIEIEKSIPVLGIEAGKYDLQRLFYYKICKAYYRPDYSIDEMNHINFDWFRPSNCYRHTPEEVELFCQDAGLAVDRMHVEASGITVIATKLGLEN